ncbi:MAG: hypothetical protein HOE90_14400 [Bacteriovoracaceae bacterium]|nr:hypothetical protein [Bacteriovoracaceae bacterium]
MGQKLKNKKLIWVILFLISSSVMAGIRVEVYNLTTKKKSNYIPPHRTFRIPIDIFGLECMIGDFALMKGKKHITCQDKMVKTKIQISLLLDCSQRNDVVHFFVQDMKNEKRYSISVNCQ